MEWNESLDGDRYGAMERGPRGEREGWTDPLITVAVGRCGKSVCSRWKQIIDARLVLLLLLLFLFLSPYHTSTRCFRTH